MESLRPSRRQKRLLYQKKQKQGQIVLLQRAVLKVRRPLLPLRLVALPLPVLRGVRLVALPLPVLRGVRLVAQAVLLPLRQLLRLRRVRLRPVRSGRG
jgi:hypothetical protein